MLNQETHTMELDRTHPSGAEEWHCPTCGRRMVMQWPPAYKKIVLVAGDPLALHSGGKGGARISSADLAEPGAPPAAPADDTPLDEEALRPWRKFLDSLDGQAGDAA